MTEASRIICLTITAQQLIDVMGNTIKSYYTLTNTYIRWDMMDEEDKLEYYHYFCERVGRQLRTDGIIEAYLCFLDDCDTEDSILWKTLKSWSQRTTHDDDEEEEEEEEEGEITIDS
jgi:hypothetical protein